VLETQRESQHRSKRISSKLKQITKKMTAEPKQANVNNKLKGRQSRSKQVSGGANDTDRIRDVWERGGEPSRIPYKVLTGLKVLSSVTFSCWMTLYKVDNINIARS